MCACVCVYVCMHACMHAYVCVCVCVLGGGTVETAAQRYRRVEVLTSIGEAGYKWCTFTTEKHPTNKQYRMQWSSQPMSALTSWLAASADAGGMMLLSSGPCLSPIPIDLR